MLRRLGLLKSRGFETSANLPELLERFPKTLWVISCCEGFRRLRKIGSTCCTSNAVVINVPCNSLITASSRRAFAIKREARAVQIRGGILEPSLSGGFYRDGSSLEGPSDTLSYRYNTTCRARGEIRDQDHDGQLVRFASADSTLSDISRRGFLLIQRGDS